ncbi:MAG: hypothetical protein EOO10_04815 [Chitinophagaceae bacterium]|nr:MAG: hypothetical protein EOO10_04815 [Chitinophagaceae bacterium]
MIKTIFQECVEIVKDLVGNDYLYFDHSVEVKTTPHTYPFSAWAVCVSPKDELYVMDSDEQWHKVELEDVNASLVIGSLYQRLKLMRINYAKAS